MDVIRTMPELRMFFIHFWANDDAGKLARYLFEALGQVKIGKGNAVIAATLLLNRTGAHRLETSVEP